VDPIIFFFFLDPDTNFDVIFESGFEPGSALKKQISDPNSPLFALKAALQSQNRIIFPQSEPEP
jgi:hypothetical protein